MRRQTLEMNLCGIWIILALTATLARAGEPTQTFVTLKGERFEKARVTEITPATITIMHATGVATVPLSDFGLDVQKQFGYDEAKAKAWLEQLAEQQRQMLAAAAKAEEDARRAKNAEAQARRARDREFEAQLSEMRSRLNSVYDSATGRWYRSREEADEARSQALKDALEARHYQRP